MATQKQITINRNFRRLVLWMISAVAIVWGGCSSEKQALGRGTAPADGQISRQELRDRLDDFAAEYKSILDAAINEIEQRYGTKKTQMLSLQMRVKVLQGLNAMLDQDDPVVSFVNTWALCMRLRIYFEEGEGARLYGENQTIIVDAAKHIESNIENIGKLFLADSTLETTRQNIKEFALINPVRRNFSNLVLYAAETKSGQPSPFQSIAHIPMSPFRVAEGVDRTATAVNRFTDTADRFSDVVADLPEATRWQLLMLLYELEESEMANSLVSSTANLSESAAKLANFSDRLPERIQEQLTLLLDDVDRKQANLQETLRQAEKVSGNVQAALDKVRDASISIDTTAQSVKDTADAWREAAKTTGHVAKEIMQLKPERKDSAPPTSIQDVQQTIDKVAAAAVELRTASAELKQLAESDFISKTTATLVWRAVELVAAILAMTLLYKWIARKMDKTTKTAV